MILKNTSDVAAEFCQIVHEHARLPWPVFRSLQAPVVASPVSLPNSPLVILTRLAPKNLTRVATSAEDIWFGLYTSHTSACQSIVPIGSSFDPLVVKLNP